MYKILGKICLVFAGDIVFKKHFIEKTIYIKTKITVNGDHRIQ